MPTRLCSPLLLAFAAACASADVGVGGDVLVPQSSYARIRPGVSSSGPRGMVHVDALVEPAAFHSLGLSAPLPPSPSAVGDALRAAKDSPPSELKLAVAPSTPPIATAAPPASPPATEPVIEPLVEPATATPLLEGAAPPLPSAPTASPPDAAVAPAPAKVAAPPAGSPGRLLFASPSAGHDSPPRPSLPANPLDAVMKWRPSSQQMTATGAGLAITIGLLLSFVWLIRSMAPKSSRQLPREVVEVLGRAPLAGKQMTQLLRFGHKLLLVAITPDGVETLTEITDPEEVARLVAACDASSGRGSTAEFDALLRQMETERTNAGFLDARDDARDDDRYTEASFDPRSLAAAYANTPGGRGDG